MPWFFSTILGELFVYATLQKNILNQFQGFNVVKLYLCSQTSKKVHVREMRKWGNESRLGGFGSPFKVRLQWLIHPWRGKCSHPNFNKYTPVSKFMYRSSFQLPLSLWNQILILIHHSSTLSLFQSILNFCLKELFFVIFFF